MAFVRTKAPAEYDPAWLDRELEEIEKKRANDLLQLKELHVEPIRPRLGQIVLADGVDWNPGSGQGFYVYFNGAWQPFLNGLGAGSITETMLATNSVSTVKIQNQAVTFAKIQNISTQRLLGRNSAATGSVEQVTVDQVLDWIAGTETKGDIIYRTSGAYARLAAGTIGQFLQAQGAATNPLWADGLRTQTVQATTSGTGPTFSSIPSFVKRITVLFDNVSLSGTDNFIVQIGDSGGIETTGYASVATVEVNALDISLISVTNSFGIQSGNAARQLTGRMTLEKITGNVWVSAHMMTDGSTRIYTGAGVKTLSGTLDRVLVTRSGTDTFDGGQVNILME